MIYAISHHSSHFYFYQGSIHDLLTTFESQIQPAFIHLFISPVFPIANPTSLVYTMIHSTTLALVLLIYSQTIISLHCTTIKIGFRLDVFFTLALVWFIIAIAER